MSVDINWESLTGGDDGEALAEAIRDFIHERFQHIQLPKLIRSVKVHGFDFGTSKPEIVLKDIGDPLQDFYEDDVDDRGSGEGPNPPHAPHARPTERHARTREHARRSSELELVDQTHAGSALGLNGPHALFGGTSNVGYFHMPLSAGLSGTNTPLAAVAGAQWNHGLPSLDEGHQHHHSDSFGSVTPPTLTPASSRPVSRDASYFEHRAASSAAANLDGSAAAAPHPPSAAPPRSETEQADRHPEDMQVVFHLTYAGDVRLSMTADVFLDYPMPSFVGIPLKLNITGARFDGVGILAYIRKRAHLCFLAPEDAEALVGSDSAAPTSPSSSTGSAAAAAAATSAASTRGVETKTRVGGLLEEIKIESEMGEAGEGRQVLKNVGKIEKFILEQVQRIFEDEFVYPSFWTFLV